MLQNRTHDLEGLCRARGVIRLREGEWGDRAGEDRETSGCKTFGLHHAMLERIRDGVCPLPRSSKRRSLPTADQAMVPSAREHVLRR
jgi:hypothetical protein